MCLYVLTVVSSLSFPVDLSPLSLSLSLGQSSARPVCSSSKGAVSWGLCCSLSVPVLAICTRASFAPLTPVPQRAPDVCVLLAADLGSLSSKPWWWAAPRTSQLVSMICVGWSVWCCVDGPVCSSRLHPWAPCHHELCHHVMIGSLCNCSHTQNAVQMGPCYTGKLRNSHNRRAPFFLYDSFQFCVPSFKNSDLESIQYVLEKTVHKVSIVFF